MRAERQTRDPPLLQELARSDGAAASASKNAVATPGLWGMLSRFMFNPASRATGSDYSSSSRAASPRSPSTRAAQSQMNLPKTDSQGSFVSEYFGDPEIDFELVSDGDDGEASPRTPLPPSIRRNGNSFGSFGSLSDVAQV